jgi:hypothetical protein
MVDLDKTYLYSGANKCSSENSYSKRRDGSIGHEQISRVRYRRHVENSPYECRMSCLKNPRYEVSIIPMLDASSAHQTKPT